MKNIVKETRNEKDIQEFLNIKWRYLYTRRMTYQKTRLYQYGLWKGFYDVYGYKQHYEINRFIRGEMICYVADDEIDSLEKYLVEKFKDPKFVEDRVQSWSNRIEKEFDEYLAFMRGLPRKLSTLQPQEIADWLDRYYEVENMISIDCWTLFVSVEKALIEALRDLLAQQGLTEAELMDLLKRLAEPKKFIPLDSERLSLLKIALAKESEQEDLLQQHTEEYGYMPMYDVDYEPYDFEYFEDRLKGVKRLSDSDIEKEMAEIEDRYRKREDFFSDTVLRKNWNGHLRVLLKFFSAYGYLKDRKPYVRDKGSYYIRPLFEEISRRLGLPLSQLLFMHEDEIRNALLAGLEISVEDLSERINNSAYLCRDSEILIVTDVNSLKLIDAALVTKEAAELKGFSVSPGCVQGRVSIVLSNNDFSKFNEGEILVTSATRPDFVPVMKKAKAIVTDEGGMLSHAAIVARELGIPCLVGTGTATRILKDGDLVEVDADEGIIRKL